MGMTMKQVLEHLIKNSILVKDPNSGRYVLGEYGYIHLEEQVPKPQENSTSTKDIWELATKVRNIFPQGIKTGGGLHGSGVYVRSSVGNIAQKLKVFKKKYPGYSDEDILAGTRAYVQGFVQSNYMYIKMADYFILKDNTSMLASFIDNLEETPEDNPQEQVRGDVV